MKKKTVFLLSIYLCLITCLEVSCKKENKKAEQTSENKVKEVSQYHKWYYFSDEEILPVDKPQNVPVKQFIPWTETKRITSANITSSDSEAFALVNRMGILCFNGKSFSLKRDISLFENRTVENLVFFNDVPLFSAYKSSFFNDTIFNQDYSDDNTQHYFLLQFDKNTGVSYPIINSDNLTNYKNTEIIDYVWDGRNWLCSLKTVNENRVSFSYVKWTPLVPLLSLSPATVGENIICTDSTSEDFRNAKEQISYSEAPERIKKLLAGFSDKIPFSIEVKTAGGYSNRRYYNKIEQSEKQELMAKAIIAESWSAALFEDGTLYIEGALPGKHILRGGKTIAIRLPKLPPQFVYSDFVISDTTLYAAWEEVDFYKTNRSGFMSLDLDSSLYKKIR